MEIHLDNKKDREVELEVRNLVKHFKAPKGKKLTAVNNISFNIYKGEVLGIVGESGCGKTTCGKTCLGIHDKDSGGVLFRGKDIHKLSKKESFRFAKEAQMVFQDPYSSLDPNQKVYSILSEGISIHKLAASKKEEKKMVEDLLHSVGLNPEHAYRNIHEFLGGQRQRIGIARALSVKPDFLFCDEPLSALDVSIQAQITNLLLKLKREKDLTMLFVSHDLAMVKYICDRVAVMYLGNIVEISNKISPRRDTGYDTGNSRM